MGHPMSPLKLSLQQILANMNNFRYSESTNSLQVGNCLIKPGTSLLYFNVSHLQKMTVINEMDLYKKSH